MQNIRESELPEDDPLSEAEVEWCVVEACSVHGEGLSHDEICEQFTTLGACMAFRKVSLFSELLLESLLSKTNWLHVGIFQCSFSI
jgi:hypothetical protein